MYPYVSLWSCDLVWCWRHWSCYRIVNTLFIPSSPLSYQERSVWKEDWSAAGAKRTHELSWSIIWWCQRSIPITADVGKYSFCGLQWNRSTKIPVHRNLFVHFNMLLINDNSHGYCQHTHKHIWPISIPSYTSLWSHTALIFLSISLSILSF